jgi:FlaA1/EpsC-like NDP-sugar epimerase
MVGGEIFVVSMGSCDIISLAKAVSGNRPFKFIEVGHKPGEKMYEELVTESEAPRTVQDGNIYVVLPETVDIMPDDIGSKYSKYEKLPRLKAPLRSDESLLSQAEVVSMLRSAEPERYKDIRGNTPH